MIKTDCKLGVYNTHILYLGNPAVVRLIERYNKVTDFEKKLIAEELFYLVDLASAELELHVNCARLSSDPDFYATH